MFTQIKLCFYGALVVVVGALFAWGSRQHVHNQRLTHELQVAQANYKGLNQHFQQVMDQRNQLQKIDDQHTKALTNATQTIHNLGVQLNVGQRQLYIKNAVIHKLSQASSTSSVGYATTCGLNKAGQQDYLTLLKLIARQKEQLLYLQDYAKAVSG